VQGEGGVVVPRPGYLAGVRKLADENGWLMMVDEVQTGMGRTGRWFGHQHDGIAVDVMTLAKALGNGVPIGACLARGIAAEMIQPGKHGSTFGGNPLACRAALAVIETLETERLVERAGALGSAMLDGFKAQLGGVSGVVSCRGKGLMLGIELDRPCGECVARALEQRLLINVTAGNVIRLLPPLIISDEEAEQIVATVSALVKAFLANAQ
jgi:acetylornithine aminotransferase